jgi:hypothetical protein
MKRIRPRLTYANVTATIALLLALGGGGAYAASKLKKNSVTSAAIRNGQVKTKDLAKNAVVSSKIKDGQVGSADVKDGGVGAVDVAPAEGFHLVGQPGEPAFSNGGEGDCIWSNFTGGGGIPADTFNPVGFFKDPYGVVHLVGIAQRQNGPGGDAACGPDFNDHLVFQLPEGYRPVHVEFGALGTSGSAPTVIIGAATDKDIGGGTLLPPGMVTIPGNDSAAILDGVTFRAAGPGNNLPRKSTAGARGGSGSGGPVDLERLFK